MIAEELIAALRDSEHWAKKCKCPRESNFLELYEVLGDKEKQDKIRSKYDIRPCFILRKDPNACESLPDDIGEAKKGEPCPNNPYHREMELISRLEDSRALLDIANHFGDLVELGTADVNDTSPEEWAVMKIMRQRSQQLNALRMLGGQQVENDRD